MTLRERLERLLEDLPEGGSVTLTRSSLEGLLESSVEAPGGGEDPIGDLTVQGVAEELDRSESTVRGWCADGLIEGAYKLRGREWRVPPAAFRRFLEREANGETKRPGPALGGPETSLSAWREHRNGGGGE